MALLTSFAPLILSVGLKIIEIFFRDAAEKEQARVNFVAWVKAKFGDGVLSVEQHDAYNAQLEALKKKQQDANQDN